MYANSSIRQEKIVDPSPADLMKEAQMEAEVMAELQNIDRLLDMLSRIDPQKDSFSENEELQNLYNSTLSIRPKLVRLIEKYSLKKGWCRHRTLQTLY